MIDIFGFPIGTHRLQAFTPGELVLQSQEVRVTGWTTGFTSGKDPPFLMAKP